ncbi:MAG: hypothetical protein Q4F60_03665 [Candidatus Saccharibacteria bacterium]|nr:hypothetical protein [Candidatus Saccharibacteria bacterium]
MNDNSFISDDDSDLNTSLSVPVSGDIRKKHKRATLSIIFAIFSTILLLLAILLVLKLFTAQ